MGTRIRLRRTGKRKQAYYRVVVADSRSPRDGRFIEVIGNYNPKADPPQIEISEERVLYWLMQGAKPSDTVRSLLSKKGILAKLAKEKPEHAVLKRPPKRTRPGVEVEQLEPVSTEATPDVVEEAAQPVEPEVDAPDTAVEEEIVAQEEPVEEEPESPPEEEPVAEEPESPPEVKPAEEEPESPPEEKPAEEDVDTTAEAEEE